MGIVSVCSTERLNSFAIVIITDYSESWEVCSTEGKIWRCSDKFECWQTWLSQQRKEIQHSAFVHLCSVCCWYWCLVNTSNPKHALVQLKEKKMPNHGLNSSVCVSLQAAARWKVKSWRKQQTFTISTHHRRTQGTHQAISTAEFFPWIQQKVRSWKEHLQWQMCMSGTLYNCSTSKSYCGNTNCPVKDSQWQTEHLKWLFKCISKFILDQKEGEHLRVKGQAQGKNRTG